MALRERLRVLPDQARLALTLRNEALVSQYGQYS